MYKLLHGNAIKFKRFLSNKIVVVPRKYWKREDLLLYLKDIGKEAGLPLWPRTDDLDKKLYSRRSSPERRIG